MSCVFCQIVAGTAPAKVIRDWPDAMAIVPLNPVTRGHLLVLPKAHVRNAMVDPVVTATTMARVASLAQEPCNIITSAGSDATQTVFHLHVHIVPRLPGDGLVLPWTLTEERNTARDLLTELYSELTQRSPKLGGIMQRVRAELDAPHPPRSIGLAELRAQLAASIRERDDLHRDAEHHRACEHGYESDIAALVADATRAADTIAAERALSDRLAAALRGIHFDRSGYCDACGGGFPCSTVRVIDDAFREAREEDTQ